MDVEWWFEPLPDDRGGATILLGWPERGLELARFRVAPGALRAAADRALPSSGRTRVVGTLSAHRSLGVTVPVGDVLDRTARGLVLLRAVVVHADELVVAVDARRVDARGGLVDLPDRWGEANPELDPWLEIETADGHGRIALGHRGPVHAEGELRLAPAGPGVSIAPLPREGVIRVRALWPDADVDGSVELDAAPLAARASEAVQLPAEPDEPPSWLVDAPEPPVSWSTSMAGAPEERASAHPPRLLGSTLDWHDVVGCDAEAAIAAGPVQAFPDGFTVGVSGHVRVPVESGWTGYGPGAGAEVEVTVRDGEDRELAATPQHGASDAGLRSVTYWVTPLPAVGDVTVECAWPARRLGPCVTVIDGDALRAAAGRAEELGP
jgi:hypothetical protein